MTAPLFCVLLASLAAPSGTHDAPEICGSLHEEVWMAPEMAAKTEHMAPLTEPAKGRFLVARRSVADPRFAETVILLLAYSKEGAMGVIINRPTEVRLATALPHIKELHDRSDNVFVGGPVRPEAVLLLLRSRAKPERGDLIFGDVYVSGSLQALRKSLGEAGKNARLRAYAGYAGWGPEQLDHEIGRGDWAVGPADVASIFETPPDQVWPKLIDRLSVEWAELPPDLRHDSAQASAPAGALFSAVDF